MRLVILIICVYFFTFALVANAAPVYVTDKISIGLHEDKTPESPIVKVVPSGTRLELIKQEDNLSFVSDASGITGWVDNSYISDAMPAREQLRQISTRNATLEAQLREGR